MFTEIAYNPLADAADFFIDMSDVKFQYFGNANNQRQDSL